MSRKAPAPDDEQAGKAYTRLLKEAEAFGLIVQAYGGIATLATPEEQRKIPGLRESVLQAAQLEERRA